MNLVLVIIAWVLLSPLVGIAIGTFIRAGSRQVEEPVPGAAPARRHHHRFAA